MNTKQFCGLLEMLNEVNRTTTEKWTQERSFYARGFTLCGYKKRGFIKLWDLTHHVDQGNVQEHSSSESQHPCMSGLYVTNDDS